MSTAQAAEFLGVKAATLYAYTSRGLIESVPSTNGRERGYKLSDLIRLRQSARGFKSARDAEAPVWTGPVIKSAITEIREDGHRYRGQNAIDLALKDTPFELVAELLWQTNATSTAPWKQARLLHLPRQLKSLAAPDIDSLDLIKLVLVSAEVSDPVARQLAVDDVYFLARRLIVTLATCLGLPASRDTYLAQSAFPIAQTLTWVLTGHKSAPATCLINRALVLCADHELNASALAARVAASCDASLYSCLLSAMGTFSGTLHGSASRRAEDLVTTCLKFKSANAWLKDYLRQYPKIPGFGTELYQHGDPRARLLIETAQQSASAKNQHLRRLGEMVAVVREELGLEPNLDVGLAAVSYALSLPPGAGSSIFAISRTAGWIAHATEQRQYGGVIRPRARYIGRA